MVRLLRVLLAAAIATPLVAAMPGRAIACECAVRSPTRVIHQADAIVRGRIVGELQTDATTTQSTVDVEGIYRGHVGASLVLTADIGSGGGSDCAILYPVGSRVDPLVLDRRDDGTFQTSACSLLTDQQVARVLGDSRAPPRASPGETPAFAPFGSLAALGTNWIAVLAGFVVALLAIAFVLQRMGREPRRPPSPLARLHATARAAPREPDDG